ncbi:MAG: Calx-beta domain-containing protein, partial [Lentisphaeria bacterium]|nr:Calx-beta domain-containing protein [Lentisphaeria bacterium]
MGTGSSYASGFSGYGTYDAIVGCFWDTTPPESDSRTGGTGKTTAAMQTQATFTAAGWDFVGETANGTEEIWYMRGYPALRVFATVPIQVLDVQNGSGGGGYEEGTFVTVAADEPAEGQEFASWTVDPTEHATNLADATAATTTFTIPAAAVTLTATYVTKTYTVRFDLGEHGEWTGGGDLVQTVAHGTAAVAPEFSVEDGWVFTGWNKDISAITANLAVTAFYVVLDTDNDYLPDKWEYQHFGNLDHNRADDPDRDGFTNWEEFVAGTHPDDNQSYPRDRAALVWQDAVQKLRVIGRALERYMADHGPDALPGRLMYLVDQGYLDADMLLTIGDKSGGTDPHPYEKSHFAYVYEAGVSFFYETSESLCPWTIPGYSHTPESTWYDVKMYQFAYTHGYTFSGQPYDRRAFPVVACLWMTDSMVTPSYWTRLNLALDCRTVFASPVDAWEDLSDIYLPDDPAVLRPLPSTPIVARYTVPLHIPLWFAVKDVASTHGLRLVPSGEARDGAVIGEIRDLYYVLTPDIDTPTAFTVTVEWDDGTGAAQRASFAIALDSGPDDDPDDDGLSNAAELAANTDPYDSESRLTVFFEQTTASVSESAGTVAVRCLLSGPSALPVAVDYAAVGGTATGGGTDYALASETLVFAAGETAKDIEVVVIDDELSELTESLQIALANPANVVFGSRILFTLDITDNDPHTVTYLPGLHGALPGGEPAIVLVVEYGHPVPPPPAVVPEAGWTHVGWEWTPGTRSVGPVAVTQDWTATARYAEGAPAAPSWQLDLALGGATPATLTLGMRADATDGWDAGIDGHAPPPAPGQPCLAADDFALFYSADYRAPAATAEFLLLVDNPEEEPVTISWHPPALPDHKFLSIYEAILDDLPSGRDAIARRPVGYSALDMAATASLEVPAGASRSYVIRYGDELVFDLPFRTGWNLISLPLEPLNRAVGVALEDAPPGNLDVQNIWSLARGKYAAAAELHPCIGYWVYAAGPTVLLVKGTPVAQNGLKLEKGFNLRGVATACPAPVDNRIRGGIWRWDAATMRYVPVTALQPGHGYWFQATRNAIIHLPRHKTATREQQEQSENDGNSQHR